MQALKLPAGKQRTLQSAYVEGLLINALNPKVSMFYLAVFPQFMATGECAVASAFALVVLHSLINAIWFCAMVILLTHLTKFTQKSSVQRCLKGITGTLFLGFGFKLAAYRP